MNQDFCSGPYVELDYLQFSTINLILRQALIVIDILEELKSEVVMNNIGTSPTALKSWLRGELARAVGILEQAEGSSRPEGK